MGTKARVFTAKEFEAALERNKAIATATISDEDRFELFLQQLEAKLKIVPTIGPYMSDIVCMVSLVRSFIRKEYRDVPLSTITSIVSALLYLISPIDLIPDAIPVAGYADDIALLVWVMKGIHDDTEKYKQWRNATHRQMVEEI